ncbi:Z1 domain-containing protein [Sandaracinus amylolyticus]|nr:Z1 domain-containing protein [Sandaracinus amylolyticus]
MSTGPVGIAKLATAPAPVLRGDGACLNGTLQALGAGPKPMSGAALDKIRQDALALLGRVVQTYEAEVAPGEVGADGSVCASPQPPTKPCTGLLYGRIQSGKTVAMIALVAAAIDNGFRVVVVLTSDNVTLVDQTTKRFAALEGPIPLDALNPSAWSSDHKHIGKHLAQAGVVFVCSKNKTRLDALITFLEKIGAPEFPALILDDEADQATLDANLARNVRKQTKGEVPGDPTAIYTAVVDGLRKTLRHHVFLQVTATPYALLLQSVGTELRPSFTRLLEPGDGYTGGEYFFESHHVDGPEPPLVFVDPNESVELAQGSSDAPDGLRRAIAYFLVAAGAQALTDPATARSGQNFLCHTSQLRQQHRNLEELIRTYVDRVSDDIDAGSGDGLNKLHTAFDELKRTFPSVPSVDSVITEIRRRLVTRKVIVVNSEADAEPGRGLNLIIGGNILGRGVTIDNLIVTYYLRQPKVGQMDTMLQHARMYGYRSPLMHLTRVFLPPQLAVRFHEIHRIEQRLRRQLAAADLGKPIVIERTGSLRPTRNAVLDPTYIDAFDAEDQVYPIHPDLTLKRSEYEAIAGRIEALIGDSLSTEPQLVPIEFDVMLELVETFPYNRKELSSSWVPAAIGRVLERQRDRCKGRAYLYTRRMNRRRSMLTTGAVSGKELERLRNQDGPVFAAFRDDGKQIADRPANEFWYPTVVFDRQMPSVIVNVTSDDA